MANAASGSGNGGGSGSRDLIIPCKCGGGICSVDPLLLNPRFLFVCCPKGQADGGGCGFMQWRDTVDPNNITTWNTNNNHNNINNNSPPSHTTTTIPTPITPPPPPPPPPMMMMCRCGAGPCSIGTAKNGLNFYCCSACKFRKWCDSGSSSKCFICREEGHWSMDCPRLPPYVASAAANNKTICFYCKRENHYAAQCPFKFRRRRN